MKKTNTMVTAIFGMMMRPIATNNRVFAYDLPVKARNFVQNQFPNQCIAFAEKNENGYEVSLNNGTKVSFSQEGAWDSVACKQTAFPSYLLPQMALDQMNNLFFNLRIVKVHKSDQGYDVVLSNAINLKFDQEGNFA